MAKKQTKKAEKPKPPKRRPKEDFNQAAFRAVQEAIKGQKGINLSDLLGAEKGPLLGVALSALC